MLPSSGSLQMHSPSGLPNYLMAALVFLTTTARMDDSHHVKK